MNKQEVIKSNAFKLFDEKGYEFASVNEIVNCSGISKGSYYSYYQTKEEVYLDILRDFFNAWFRVVKHEIGNVRRIEDLLSIMLGEFIKRPIFLELLSKSQVVIENNITTEVLVSYKRELHKNIEDLSMMISLKFKLDKKEAFHKLIQTYSILVGIWLCSKMPKSLKEVKTDYPLSKLFTNFERDLIEISLKIWI